MVNQDIVNYLKEGKKRGFSLQILKQKLLEGGFEDREINSAILELNRIEIAMNPRPQFSSPILKPQPITRQTSPSTSQPIQQKTHISSPAPASKPIIVSSQQKPIQPIQSSSLSQQNSQPQPTQQKPQYSPQPQQTQSQTAQSPLSSSYLNQKPTLNGEPISLWLKISGVMGVAILIFSIIFSLAVFSLNNPIVSIIYIAIIIAFSISYIFGFFKIGKRTDSKLMKLSSISMLILLSFAFVIFLISAFSENKILASLSALTSHINSGFAAFLVISTISILILLIISKAILSISLIKLKNQIKLAGFAGIISLIACLFAVISLILFFILIFSSPEIFSSSTTSALSSLGDSLLKAGTTGLLFVISTTILVSLKFISMVLEIILLFKNSKDI